jgi:hypothetical protein
MKETASEVLILLINVIFKILICFLDRIKHVLWHNFQPGLLGWPTKCVHMGRERRDLALLKREPVNRASPVLMGIKSQKHIKTIYMNKARYRHLQVGPARWISLDLVNSPYKEVVCRNYYISWHCIKNLANINNTITCDS